MAKDSQSEGLTDALSPLEPQRNPDPTKTLARAAMVLILLGISLTGLIYSVWLLWTLPAKK